MVGSVPVRLIHSQAPRQPLTITQLVVHKPVKLQEKSVPSSVAPGVSSAHPVAHEEEVVEDVPRARRKSASNAFVPSSSREHA
jgi:hypothetical protein